MIAYFLLQIGIGIIFVGNLSLIGKFSPGRRTSSLLKVNMGSTTAFIIAPLLVSLMLFINTDWRNYYLFNLIFLSVLVILLWKLRMPDSIKVKSTLKTLFAANKKIISNASFIICGIIIFFYISVVNTFFMWFTSYFQNIDIGINISSLFLAIYGLAVVIGMLIRYRLIRHFREKNILLIGFIASFLLLIGILFIQNLIIKNILIFLFGLAISGNFSITFSIGSELFPEYTSSASGLMVAFANLGIMVFQYLSGYLSEYYSKNSILYINIGILLILIILTTFLNFHKKFRSKDQLK
jgi:predicted MFS family arabinose efflux permease